MSGANEMMMAGAVQLKVVTSVTGRKVVDIQALTFLSEHTAQTTVWGRLKQA